MGCFCLFVVCALLLFYVSKSLREPNGAYSFHYRCYITTNQMKWIVYDLIHVCGCRCHCCRFRLCSLSFFLVYVTPETEIIFSYVFDVESTRTSVKPKSCQCSCWNQAFCCWFWTMLFSLMWWYTGNIICWYYTYMYTLYGVTMFFESTALIRTNARHSYPSSAVVASGSINSKLKSKSQTPHNKRTYTRNTNKQHITNNNASKEPKIILFRDWKRRNQNQRKNKINKWINNKMSCGKSRVLSFIWLSVYTINNNNQTIPCSAVPAVPLHA